MFSQLGAYRAMSGQLPAQMRRWHLYGAGMNQLRQVVVDIPAIKPDELLVRNDACGICYSDVKIVNLGQDHPRLQGRNLKNHPIVLGHECVVTVARVGDDLRDRYAIGQRFVVQPDATNHGVDKSYGYTIDGGMSEYSVFGREILEADDGCHLISVPDGMSYVEAALAEPWACVEAAYDFANYRSGIMDHGRLLIVDVDGNGSDSVFLERHCHRAGQVTTITDIEGTDFGDVRRHLTGDAGFDDIVILGPPAPHDFPRIASALGARGILNLVSDRSIAGPVPIDLGRIHYDQQLYVGATAITAAGEAYTSNQRQELQPGGALWLAGGGGPMGQMHLWRAMMRDAPPSKIVVTEKSAERVTRLRERFDAVAESRGIELAVECSVDGAMGPNDQGPFDDIITLVPSGEFVAAAAQHLSDGGVINAFAGVNRGVSAILDLSALLAHNRRIIGTSGSSIDSLRHTVSLIESGKLPANASLAAIGGLDALCDGLSAVRDGRFAGKAVIFPAISGVPLMPLEDMKENLPTVYAKLQDGRTWTRESEDALLAEFAGKAT